MGYTSDVSDQEFAILEPLLPKRKNTRPPKWTKREIINGIFYYLKNGCSCVDLPKDLPPSGTVFWYYDQWREEGVIDQIHTELHSQVREQEGKSQSGQPC